MLTFDSIPQVRVVRAGGQLMSPPPAPPEAAGAVAQHLRTLLAYAIGLWPLTSIVLLMFGLLYFAGMYSSP